MADIDLNAFQDANKGLSVLFIISIFLINLLLIYKTVRKGGFLYNPKSMTIISLAFGDAFLALFSLVVQARIFFEFFNRTINDLGCQTYWSSTVYYEFLIHFVYGVGLIFLAVELVLRYKGTYQVGNTSTHMVKAIVYSAVPWILGLIIILPITMADMSDIYSCIGNITKYRLRVMCGISVILPASLALVLCIVVMCIRLVPYTTAQTITYQGTTQGVVLSTQNTTNVPQQYPMNGVVGTQQMASAPPGTYYNQVANQNTKLGDQGVTSPNTQYPPPQYAAQNYPPSQYPGQQYLPPQYPGQQYLPPQYPGQQYPPQQYPAQLNAQSNVIITAPVYSVQPQNTTGSSLADPGREKNMLLVVAIVYFVCVLPFAVYTMGTLADDYSYGSIDIALNNSFMWLSIFRSLITPIIWIISFRN